VRTAKTTNFPATLPPPQSDLVQQTVKDPYIFDFLSLGEEAHERDLERALVVKIKDFLLELGVGFAFMGNQYHLEVGGQDFYIDLLFYHHRLRCMVAIDLKMEDFQPEFLGKMNFYLSALDEMLRHPDDQPSVGIILCKGKNKTIAEYAPLAGLPLSLPTATLWAIRRLTDCPLRGLESGCRRLGFSQATA
jgi:predicted nuclease of restriction endonuclease-like (RecB) superfamily